MGGEPQGITDARNAFAASLKIMSAFTNFGASAQRANLYADIAISEAYFGDCALLNDYLHKFAAEIVKADVLPEAAKSLRGSLAQNLGNQNRCQWDRSLINVA
jgi:hypothetical protein